MTLVPTLADRRALGADAGPSAQCASVVHSVNNTLQCCALRPFRLAS